MIVNRSDRRRGELSDKAVTAFGQNVRTERAKRGWSQAYLATLAGVSRAMISQIERGRQSPTLNVILRIADGFGVMPSRLLDGARAGDVIIVRGKENQPFIDPLTGYTRYVLCPTHSPLDVEFIKVILPANRTSSAAPHRAGAKEHVVVLNGDLEVILEGNQVYTLQEGDAITYMADQQHTFRNAGQSDCIFFLVHHAGH